MKLQALPHIFALLPIFLPLVNGAPARRDSNPGLRGSEDLIGYSPSEVVPHKAQPSIQYKLVPGQKEDADIGAYLDFVNADNPQPIRGSGGGDDPGPRRSFGTLTRQYD